MGRQSKVAELLVLGAGAICRDWTLVLSAPVEPVVTFGELSARF